MIARVDGRRSDFGSIGQPTEIPQYQKLLTTMESKSVEQVGMFNE